MTNVVYTIDGDYIDYLCQCGKASNVSIWWETNHRCTWTCKGCGAEWTATIWERKAHNVSIIKPGKVVRLVDYVIPEKFMELLRKDRQNGTQNSWITQYTDCKGKMPDGV